MAESQSRYSIMESLNTKKIAAQKSLSELKREMQKNTHIYNNNKILINQNIKMLEENCENNFIRWKNDKEFEIEELKQKKMIELADIERNYNKQIKELELIITKNEKNYIQNNKYAVEEKKRELEQETRTYDEKMEDANLKIEAIEDEIKGYEKTINDLKEVSKESTKE